jgi:ribosomal protein L11 methyltransferase
VIRLAVRVRRADAELVLAELLELAPGGVEEVQVGDDVIEYAVYGAPGELPDLPDLRAAAGQALVDISTSETADDWQERWKQFHRSVLIEPPEQSTSIQPLPALRVRPPWEPERPREGLLEIVIDPGQAFGTGAHATTRLCLQMLLELAADEPEHERGGLLDVGSGSGVLAIAARRLGFGPVLALDHDRLSVDAVGINAASNQTDIEVRRWDLRAEPLPWLGAPDAPQGSVVVLANLLCPLLLELASKLDRAPAQLIAGGLLRPQVDAVVRAFGEHSGMREHARAADGEWAAVWLVGERAS